jgi:two-component system, cell cycle sensor histidine kinase and response regulator CckA
MNLAANARDAMPAGGTLTIETSNVELDEAFVQTRAFVPRGRYILLEVTDSGSGIPAEHVPHVFEPFYTTKAQGKGTGLGLATVYGIVKQSAGFVWVSSKPSCGTTFKIYFPEVRPQVPATPVARPVAIMMQRGSETILLVEDEQAVRQASAEFLRNTGYTVLEATNGQDALDLMRKHTKPIHLVITDVVMPLMSGGELAEHLPQCHPEAKVLFVSGYAESTVKNHRIVDLRSNFMQKPFSLQDLSGKIRALLSNALPPVTR